MEYKDEGTLQLEAKIIVLEKEVQFLTDELIKSHVLIKRLNYKVSRLNRKAREPQEQLLFS